jgi:hypothetical protein
MSTPFRNGKKLVPALVTANVGNQPNNIKSTTIR